MFTGDKQLTEGLAASPQQGGDFIAGYGVVLCFFSKFSALTCDNVEADHTCHGRWPF